MIFMTRLIGWSFLERRLFAFDPEFSTYVSSNINTLPTGGYFAIWLAIQKCVNINVYGFHFGQGFGVDHHYFNDELPKQGQNAIHDYNAEFEMIKELARADIVHFPIPCAAGCENETGIPDKVRSMSYRLFLDQFQMIYCMMAQVLLQMNNYRKILLQSYSSAGVTRTQILLFCKSLLCF